MLRSILAVICGLVTWFVAATIGNFGLRAWLPGYVAVERSMAFSTTMLCWRLVLGFVSSIAAGYVVSWIAGRHKPATDFAFAVVIVLFFLPVHYGLWPKFPIWYHVAFLGLVGPFAFLGATLRRRQWTMQESGAAVTR
jgi:hypothetical protein